MAGVFPDSPRMYYINKCTFREIGPGLDCFAEADFSLRGLAVPWSLVFYNQLLLMARMWFAGQFCYHYTFYNKGVFLEGYMETGFYGSSCFPIDIS